MLHDSQKFHIDGKTKEELKSAIELLLKFDGGKITGYKFDDDQITFLWYVKEDAEGVNKLPQTNNASLLTDLCWDWLLTKKDDPKEKEDPYFDGTTRLGWDLNIDNGFWSRSFKVKPTWLYYGK